MSGAVFTADEIVRFCDRLEIGKRGRCWEWTGGRDGNGYGRIRVGGRQQGAHRISYELFVGPVPTGLELDHLCRLRHCVNPGHLEPVTHAENMRRGALARWSERMADRFSVEAAS